MRPSLPLLPLTLMLSTCLLGACTPGPERPAPPVINTDAQFSAPFPGGSMNASPGGPWWRQAVSETIWPPLEQALSANPQLREAEAEIDAARAQLSQAEADTGPSLVLGADYQARRESGDTSNSRSVGVDGSVPVDVSGALAYRVDAARFTFQATVADTVQLRSDLARDFLFALIDGAEATQRIALLDRQIEVSKTLLRLTELRFAQGLASIVDVLQQRDDLAALRQQIPLTRLEQKAAGNELRRLGARTPEQAPSLNMRTLPEVVGEFAPIQPVDLLDRRGSLRASRARIEAADARFASALADRLPTLRLSSDVITRAMSGDVTTAISAVVATALTLFDSGSKVAIAEKQRAELAAAGEQYLSDWYAAVIEVDNLIHAEARLRERIVLSEHRLKTVDTLLTAARRRYERGVSDYLPVLAALRAQQQQQRDHLALQAELARTRVRLHRAMG